MIVDYRHARDIPDAVFLRAISAAARHGAWACRWDVERVLGGLDPSQYIDEVPGVPGKVVLAKFRRVKHRGLADGCDCGCRGDFELTDAGRALLDSAVGVSDTNQENQ